MRSGEGVRGLALRSIVITGAYAGKKVDQKARAGFMNGYFLGEAGMP